MRSSNCKILTTAICATAFAMFAALASAATGQYQTRAGFLLESLGTDQPQSDVIWINDEIRAAATKLLGHAPDMLRMRYWYEGARTAWIINEIGKEKPITLGVVIENGEIHALRVLNFRESRGWEIRYPFFTDQFSHLRLNNKGSLSQRIDGITGATLSVNAAKRGAKLALILNEYASRNGQTATATR